MLTNQVTPVNQEVYAIFLLPGCQRMPGCSGIPLATRYRCLISLTR
jgi:hypothetical protein